jgi:hypothetical protein
VGCHVFQTDAPPPPFKFSISHVRRLHALRCQFVSKGPHSIAPQGVRLETLLASHCPYSTSICKQSRLPCTLPTYYTITRAYAVLYILLCDETVKRLWSKSFYEAGLSETFVPCVMRLSPRFLNAHTHTYYNLNYIT